MLGHLGTSVPENLASTFPKKHFDRYCGYSGLCSFSKKVISSLSFSFILHGMHLGSREWRGEICFFAVNTEEAFINTVSMAIVPVLVLLYVC